MHATVAKAELELEIPRECGEKRDFQRELRARLSDGVALPALWLAIRHSGDRYTLSLRVNQEHREFSDPDCRELLRAAVVIAVAASSEAKHDTTPVPRVTESTRRERSHPESAPARARKPIGLELGVGLGAEFGLLPTGQPALELSLRAQPWRRIGFSLAGRYLAKGARLSADGRGIELDAAGFTSGAYVVLLPELHGLLGFGAYRLGGRAIGSESRQYGSAWAGGPLAAVTAYPVRLSHFSLGVIGELQWQVLRPEFTILHYGRIFRVPPYSGAMYLRLGWSF